MEEVRCDGGICEHGRLTGIVADHRAAGENRADLFKLGGVVPHVVEIRAGERKIDHIAAPHVALDQRQAAGIAIRQRLQQYGIDHTENRGAGSDTQGDGANRYQREGGTLAETTAGVQQILNEHRGNYARCGPKLEIETKARPSRTLPAPGTSGPIMEHAWKTKS